LRLRPGGPESLPLAPAFLLLAGALAAAWGREGLRARLQASLPGSRAVLALLALAALSTLLYATLVRITQQTLRAQIERDYAPLVLRQPEWRQYVLQGTERAIESMNLLGDAPPGIYYPGIEELAFAVWA